MSFRRSSLLVLTSRLGVLLIVAITFSSCYNLNSHDADQQAQALGIGEPTAMTMDSDSGLSFDRPPSFPELASGEYQPLPPEKLQDGLKEAGKRWLYGPGFGRTLTNVGTIIVFPPYGLYLLANAGIAFAGYEPIYVTDSLPETPRSQVLTAYDGVTSVPGRISAFLADKEYGGGRENP